MKSHGNSAVLSLKHAFTLSGELIRPCTAHAFEECSIGGSTNPSSSSSMMSDDASHSSSGESDAADPHARCTQHVFPSCGEHESGRSVDACSFDNGRIQSFVADRWAKWTDRRTQKKEQRASRKVPCYVDLLKNEINRHDFRAFDPGPRDHGTRAKLASSRSATGTPLSCILDLKASLSTIASDEGSPCSTPRASMLTSEDVPVDYRLQSSAHLHDARMIDKVGPLGGDST
eukprot:TRINITY_DN4606_c0_g1_i1.p1 TRINITY_DN4606_c0_g1~~TRINITY_DN4606_c0_g1_i1.p1  ORF type:complete len:246 (+),score=14.12 TRINITY_DN4606_c0_g1_i1:47-739(+)